MLNVFDQIAGGLKGGRSKSKRKQAAARRNGRTSKGRPLYKTRTRTLGEFLLRRKLTDKQHVEAWEGYLQLRGKDDANQKDENEKLLFRRFFGIEQFHYGRGYKVVPHDALNTMQYHARRPKHGTKMHLILSKFLLVARSKL